MRTLKIESNNNKKTFENVSVKTISKKDQYGMSKIQITAETGEKATVYGSFNRKNKTLFVLNIFAGREVFPYLYAVM